MARSVRFTPAAWDDDCYWQGQDKKCLLNHAKKQTVPMSVDGLWPRIYPGFIKSPLSVPCSIDANKRIAVGVLNTAE